MMSGIDWRQYRLLLELFRRLSERREYMTQLGREGITLKYVALLYFGFSALFSLLAVAVQPSLGTFFWSFQGITGALLMTILVSETSNSLVNPEEGLVLAHQPINGATYTAAKLSHLLRILLYLVPGLNGPPALAGLGLKGAMWHYPLTHLATAFAVGLVVTLGCCAAFGWLLRFVPPSRMKSAGQTAEMLPWLAIMFQGQARSALSRWHLGAPAPWMWALLGAVGLAAIVFGLRSLSADYLVRVATIAHGSARNARRPRRSRLSDLVARWWGGPAARAGFEFVPRMMRRDWNMRRQLLPLLPGVIGPLVLLVQGLHTTPFSGQFTVAHAVPHVFGGVLFLVCLLLPYGSDYKGAWVLLLAPGGAFDGFARGVHAFLWIRVLAVPHVLLLAVLAWAWPVGDALLFALYSLAASSTYLAAELWLIEGAPFSRQPEASRGPATMGLLIVGGLIVTLALGVQYFLIFRSRATVAVAAIVIAGVAFWLTRKSMRDYAGEIRFNLGLVSAETGPFYVEI